MELLIIVTCLVLMEHLYFVSSFMDFFAILVACTDAMGIFKHEASVHTLPLNLNVIKESGKSPKK